MSGPAIVVRGAGKRYVKYDDTPMLVTRALRLRARSRRSKLWALRDVDLEVDAGESLAVIGRNGSGKSTLLRMLAGVTAPSEGRVSVRGRVAPLIAVGVGFHPELTGRENVFINGTVLGLSRADIERRFEAILDFAGIEGFIDTPVKFYSSGMLVRLGFSVAVAAEPQVLLVDEVLAVGDVAFQLKCFNRMTEIQEAGATVVVVSHNLNAVRRICPRAALLHEGRVHHDGATAEAISLYHDLLSVDPDDAFTPARAGTGGVEGEATELPAVVERFELLGADGSPTGHVPSGDEVTFVMDVCFLRPVDDPVLGISLSTDAGVQVYGESTPWTGAGSFEAGARVRLEVRLRLRLATGSYVAQGGIRAGVETGGMLLATPTRALLFYVAGRSRVNGIVDLDGSLVLSRPVDG